MSIGPFWVSVRPFGLNHRLQTTRLPTTGSPTTVPTKDQILTSGSKSNVTPKDSKVHLGFKAKL